MYKSAILIVVAVMLATASLQVGPRPVRATVQAGPVTVLESTATQLVLQVSLPDMFLEPVQMADGETYTAVRVPDSGSFEVGEPAVPVFGNWILIPNGTEVGLEIEPGEPQVVEDVVLPPGQPPWPDLEGAPQPAFTRDEETYAADADSPGVFARLEQTKIMRGQECTIVWIYPYQHNPVRRTLSLYPNLTVTVRFHGEPSPIPDRLRSDAFDVIMRRMALNAEEILAAEEEARARATSAPDEGTRSTGSGYQFGYDYVIITDPTFAQAANKLAAWKTKAGFKTWVSSSALFKTWSAPFIKGLVQQAYDSWDIVPQYVVLMGDAEFIAPHYETLHPYETMVGAKGTQGYTGTDLYYSTLQGSDYLPDIFIGRLAVDISANAMDFVGRIVDYEKNPPTDALAGSFYDTVTIMAQFQDGITGFVNPDGIEDSRFTQTSEDLAIFLSSAPFGKTVNRIYDAEPSVTPAKWNNHQLLALKNFGGGPAGNPGDNIPAYLKKPGFAWDGDASDITSAVEAGSFLITHRDHGGRDKWSHPYYHWEDVDDLLIYWGRDPVIWSVNCQTGWFDNETDFKKAVGLTDQTADYEESFAEWWQRYPLVGGPVGMIAATRVTDSVYNDRLFWGWTDAIWPGFVPAYKQGNPSIVRMGEVLNYGKIYLSMTVPDDDGKPKGNWRKTHFEAYHWFGDPSMAIRTFEPLLMIAVFPTTWSSLLYPKDFDLHVELVDSDDQYQGPLEKATVTISKADHPSDHWVGETDEEGNVTFPGLVTSALGEYDVVVTAPGFIPYEGILDSQAGPAGGILLDAEVYSCTSEIEIKVADIHMEGAITLDVTVSASGGDEETVTLTQREMGTGMFLGTLSTASGEGVPGDGTLQVSDGQTISAEYGDEDDGTGNPAWVYDTAVVDCQPPEFEGLNSVRAEDGAAALRWHAASDQHGPITYNIYRDQAPGLPIGDLIGSTWALAYPDYDCGLGQPCTYVVRAQDALGNEDSNTVELTGPSHAMYLPLVLKE